MKWQLTQSRDYERHRKQLGCVELTRANLLPRLPFTAMRTALPCELRICYCASNVSSAPKAAGKSARLLRADVFMSFNCTANSADFF